MITLLRSILLSIICMVPAFAQNSILWEISGNGITTTSYLMGTLKFIGEEEFYIPKEAKERLIKSKIFAIEDPVDHKAQHELNKAVHFPDGQSLKNTMSEEGYDSVRQFFEDEFQIPRDRFESEYARMIPLAITIAMTRLSLGETVVYYDIELLKLAIEQKMETQSLEPAEREAEALRHFSIPDQVKALVHAINNFEKQETEFRKLVELFPHGDPAQIFQYTLHPFDNNPDFIEAFYYKRNNEWIAKIEKLVKEKPSFITVGLSHLEGGHGLIALLQEKGYTMTPVVLTR